jgi:hypothetical protein
MKNILIPCMLVFSLMTATAALLPATTLNSTNDSNIDKELKIPTIEFTEVVEEADEAFDFDIKSYLPLGFNAFTSLEYEIVLEEADASFDFNTKDYLPVGFGLKKSVVDSIKEIEILSTDETFDFDTKAYLPKDFNAAKKVNISIVI